MANYTGKLKTINELVAEGFEVYVDSEYLYLQKKGSTSYELEVEQYGELSGYSLELKDEGRYFEFKDKYNGWGDRLGVDKIFIKDLEKDSEFSTELNCGDEVEVTKDGSIHVNGNESLDKKQALEMAKAILIVNGYDVD